MVICPANFMETIENTLRKLKRQGSVTLLTANSKTMRLCCQALQGEGLHVELPRIGVWALGLLATVQLVNPRP